MEGLATDSGDRARYLELEQESEKLGVRTSIS